MAGPEDGRRTRTRTVQNTPSEREGEKKCLRKKAPLRRVQNEGARAAGTD